MTAVYVLRHPQTTWNVEERYQGRLEAPWNVEGERQCTLAVQAFEGQELAAIYSSPLRRALDLARALSRRSGSQLIVDHRLTEIGMGPWEGLYRTQIKDRFGALFEEWYDRPDLVRFPGGESPQ